MDISFIIPTYNSFNEKKGSLGLTIHSLLLQDFSKIKFEIIVVDNGSNDNTFSYIDALINNKIKYTRYLPVGSKAAARNHGVKIAKGRTIFFLDDDVLITSKLTIKNMYEKLKPKSFVCGIKRKWTHINWNKDQISNDLKIGLFNYADKISILPSGFNRDTGYRSLHEVSFIGHLGCIQKKDFEKVGGFDENYKFWGRHDCDLMYRLIVLESFEFINGFNFGTIIHLNHPTKNQLNHYSRNELRYKRLERKNGKRLIFSHLFEIYEDDHKKILVDI